MTVLGPWARCLCLAHVCLKTPDPAWRALDVELSFAEGLAENQAPVNVRAQTLPDPSGPTVEVAIRWGGWKGLFATCPGCLT